MKSCLNFNICIHLSSLLTFLNWLEVAIDAYFLATADKQMLKSRQMNVKTC